MTDVGTQNGQSEADAANVLQYADVAADPVGNAEIAQRLEIEVATVHQWRNRNVLPPADYDSINSSTAWEWRTILHWAGATGRIKPGSKAYASYRSVFGVDPAPQRTGGRYPASDSTFHARMVDYLTKRYGPGPWLVSKTDVTPMAETEFYSDPSNLEPQGPGRRRAKKK
jgi:hypothetical protein